MGFRSAQNTRVERVQHNAITQEKGECLSLVALGEIHIQFGCGCQDGIPYSRVDANVSIEDPRDRRDAYLSESRDLTQTDLCLWLLFHTIVPATARNFSQLLIE
jgi:hypothetical protein